MKEERKERNKTKERKGSEGEGWRETMKGSKQARREG